MDSPTILFCRWADCSLYFVDSEVLLLHCMNDHVGRKITNNLCLDCHWGDCDVKTSKRDHITSHLRVHIPHKPYVCSNCSKTFKRPQDLKKHEKLHGEPEELQPQSHLHSNPNSHPNTTAFVPDYLSVYSGDNSFPSRRELSPQSTSSDVLATTPPSGLPFNPHPQYNQFLNGIYNKQLTPDYNENMANMLRAMSSSNPQELAASINPDMDINGFNHFMNQLHGNVVPEAPPLFNENMNSMPPSFVDPNFNFNNNGSTPCLPSDNFAYMNQMNYNQGYGYDQNQAPAFNTMQMNCGMTPQQQQQQQLQQQQLQQQQQQQQLHQQQQQQQQHSAPFPNQSQAPMTAYPSLDFDSNLSTYQQANGLYQGMMDPKLQVSHDGTGFMAPQVDYSNGHQYLSIAVTPQRSEPRLMEDKSDKLSTTSSPDAPATEEDKETKKPAPPVTDASSGDKKSEQSGTEESTSAGLDALATQLGSLDLSPSSSKVSLSHSDSDSDSSSSDKGRLQDAALIRSLVLQVNKLFRNLHPSPSTTTTKSSTTNTASPTTSLPPKDIFPTYSPTIVECSQYPSLDDL